MSDDVEKRLAALEERVRQFAAIAGEGFATGQLALVLVERLIPRIAKAQPSPELFLRELRDEARERIAPMEGDVRTRLVADAMLRRLDDVIGIAGASFRRKD